jgi:GDPmannose 4,6-dehydratase
MPKTAFITGVTGQDGSYLAEFLLGKDYIVHGLMRRSSTPNLSNLQSILDNPSLHLVYGDLSDSSLINKVLGEIKPDEIYNLAAQSHVQVSFENPEYTADINALGALRLLEAVKNLGLKDRTRFYQASTSELFGNTSDGFLSEKTAFWPRSPYGVSKLFAFWATRNYREGHKLFASNGILFNHESPRRGEEFLTRKITLAAARIKKGVQDCLYLGNLESRRDWGYAKDYVEGMWRILQHHEPDDFVVGTGETHSVREFLFEAFNAAGIELTSNGKEGVEEEFTRKDTGEVVVKISDIKRLE